MGRPFPLPLLTGPDWRVWQVGQDGLTPHLRRSFPCLVVSEWQPAEGVVAQDLEAVTWPDDRFDLIICSDTLEHVRLYRLALVHLARCLCPGGHLLVTVPLIETGSGHREYIRVLDPARPELDERAPDTPIHVDPTDPAGCPVYREYDAAVLSAEFAALGLRVSFTPAQMEQHGIVNGIVLIGRKGT